MIALIRIPYILYLISYISFHIPFTFQTKEVKNEDIFNNMYSAVKNVKTLRANMTAFERITNHVNHTHYSIKLNISPYKAYTKDLDKGVEVLYVQGQNDNKVAVNPNGFPYFTLHFDPLNKVMREAQHQTVFRMGFSYITNILYHSLNKYPDAYNHFIKRLEDTSWDGYPCYKMQLNFASYSLNKYTVNEPGETVSSLAAKYYLSDYEILTINNFSAYDDELEIGKQILLPSAYAKSATIFIRKDNNLPVVVRIFDDKGFFEQYTYTNMQVNSTILDNEFSEKYDGYHF
jgi:outer membrane lipoprotein-sorting protein